MPNMVQKDYGTFLLPFHLLRFARRVSLPAAQTGEVKGLTSHTKVLVLCSWHPRGSAWSPPCHPSPDTGGSGLQQAGSRALSRALDRTASPARAAPAPARTLAAHYAPPFMSSSLPRPPLSAAPGSCPGHSLTCIPERPGRDLPAPGPPVLGGLGEAQWPWREGAPWGSSNGAEEGVQEVRTLTGVGSRGQHSDRGELPRQRPAPQEMFTGPPTLGPPQPFPSQAHRNLSCGTADTLAQGSLDPVWDPHTRRPAWRTVARQGGQWPGRDKGSFWQWSDSQLGKRPRQHSRTEEHAHFSTVLSPQRWHCHPRVKWPTAPASLDQPGKHDTQKCYIHPRVHTCAHACV